MTNTMTKERVTDNFDINVFNRGAWHSEMLPEEEKYDEWVLCPYRLEWDGDNYTITDELDSYNLVLTAEDVKALTLGWGTDLGGDYCEEDDFWIDANSFKDTYKDIPAKVKVWLDFVEASL